MPALENEKEFIGTKLQEMIANGVKKLVKDALAAIPELVEEAVDQPTFAASLRLECGMRYVGYNVVEDIPFRLDMGACDWRGLSTIMWKSFPSWN